MIKVVMNKDYINPYMEPGDPGCWDDFPCVMKKPDHLLDSKICPKCQGHGGWNLKLNAYPLHHYPDTMENRHLYSHFRASCNQCNGYGWTTDLDCIHSMTFVENVGNCLNKWSCTKCDHHVVYDSSD